MFGVFDLFYSDLLRGENVPRATPIDIDVQSEITSKLWKSRCKNVLSKINLSKKDSDVVSGTIHASITLSTSQAFSSKLNLMNQIL